VKLDGVFWVGGSTCSGKTSFARWLAARKRCPVYAIDEREPKSRDDVDPDTYPALARWASLSLDERWVESTVDELVADTIALCTDLFRFVVQDVAAEPRPIVVEGFQPLPELVAPVLPTERHAVFLVATPQFRQATHFARPHAWVTPRRTSNPEQAQANRIARDDRMGEHIARTASALGLATIVVDGTRSPKEVAALAQTRLAAS
jgi:hypothetical protein